jgi:hypothetical protein
MDTRPHIQVNLITIIQLEKYINNGLLHNMDSGFHIQMNSSITKELERKVDSKLEFPSRNV